MQNRFWILLLVLTLFAEAPATAAFRNASTQVVATTPNPTTDVPEANQPSFVASHLQSTSKRPFRKSTFFSRLRRLLPGSGKSQLTAAALAFFLGPFGVHRFYLGYSKIGTIQLALTVIGVFLLMAIFVFYTFSAVSLGTIVLLLMLGVLVTFGSFIWSLIDFFRILAGSLKPNNGAYEETL